ncbi:MAG TPA: Ig-like domain-containing protein [Nocardioides sp.]|uniref:L,D-transpeptidase n=1 Tax=Nocardioides sp. TaxID=35761 RepID=UPI002E33F259|nr:Ig-like domain-containing protein [Nocardioides sp.]HEX3931261.1 Ig-like domain-containing protein [Nocardioides sp.]
MSITRARVPMILGALVAISMTVAGCGAGGSKSDHGSGAVKDVLNSSASPQPSAKPSVRSNVAKGAAAVPVDHRVQVTAHNGTLTSVAVSSATGSISGQLSSDKQTWVAGGLLEPGTAYTVVSTATGTDGRSVTRTTHFQTQALTLDQQTYPSFAPLQGQTVGVGMPVIVKFDVPVTDHAAIEKNLHVVSQPAQKGSWHWISNNEVHWRPAKYWKPGTKVTVNADINGVPAGNGIFGQLDRSETFHIGASHIYKVNIQTDQLRVYDNGRLTRTIPVTTGMPGFTTRSGIKVIVEKDRYHTMNSETIGIDPNSALGYNIKNVEYAMRLTYSGEFLHAAPWSVASQGHANVSHGCTGMSTANAGWLYDHSQIGDVVDYTGSSKMMTLSNGYGDWNESFSAYKQGSALH